MTTRTDAPLTRIDDYLARLRVALYALPGALRDDIVRELRSHLIDSGTTNGGLDLARVDTALARLGAANDLARSYLDENLADRARESRSPWLLLRTALRWAGRSVAGLWALFIGFLGYSLALLGLGCAIFKPLMPERVGLWRLVDATGDHSYSLGRVSAPMPGTEELLGWWIVPIGLLLGVLAFIATTTYLRRRFHDLAAGARAQRRDRIGLSR